VYKRFTLAQSKRLELSLKELPNDRGSEKTAWISFPVVSNESFDENTRLAGSQKMNFGEDPKSKFGLSFERVNKWAAILFVSRSLGWFAWQKGFRQFWFEQPWSI
jgi:hypothetical protein